jgi:hypothetical protein
MSKPTSYVVSSSPELPQSYPAWTHRELRKIAMVLMELVDRIPYETDTAPMNPRVGQIVYARSPWNPGAGDGFYGWTGTSWTKLN